MSIFADEWRACLRAQYKHVVRVNDSTTRESLTGIMLEIGFTDSELAELSVEATMRAEDMPDDFLPDMTILEQVTPSAPKATGETQDFRPHPLECQCPACIEIALLPHDEEGQPLDRIDEERLELEERRHQDPDAPQQMSLL